MKSNTLIVVTLIAAGAGLAYVYRSQLGIAAVIDPNAARQAAIRNQIGVLPRELTPKEIADAKDAQTGLVQNVAQYGSMGSVGGVWGAAGGAAFGAFKELFD